MQNSPLKIEYLVIGAGIAGMHFAHLLTQRGKTVVILEKSRGVGGRIATRRIEGQGFDHGAASLPLNGGAHHLFDRYFPKASLIKNRNQFYISGGMNQLPKKMSEGLFIQKETKAETIEKFEDKWLVKTDKEFSYLAKNLIITAPLPQGKELLVKSAVENSLDIVDVPYAKELLSLNVLEHLSDDDLVRPLIDNGIMIQRHRGLHPNGVIVEAGESLSEKLFDKPDEEILNLMHEILIQKLGPHKVKSRELKKWRYCLPKGYVEKPFHEVTTGIYMIGDCFLTPGPEGSVLSAEILAQRLS